LREASACQAIAKSTGDFRWDIRLKLAYKPSALTLVVAGFGALAILAAVSARYLGLGEHEGFILFKAVGISRTALAYIGIATLLAAFVIERLLKPNSAGVWRMPSRLNWLPVLRAPGNTRSVLSANDQSGIAVTFAVTGLVLFLTLTAFPRSTPPLPLHHLPELMIAYNLADGSIQSNAHRIVVGLVALGVLFAGVMARHNFRIFHYERDVPSFLGALILILPLLAWWLALTNLLLVRFVAGIVLGSGILILLLTANRRFATWIGVALMLGFCALIVVPGYMGPLRLIVEQPYDLAQLELHLTWMVQPSSVLAAGFRLFDDFTPGYGFIVPTLTAAFERHFGLLDIGGQLRLVQLSEVAFLVAAVAVFYRARGRLLPALLPLAFVGPYLTTAGPFIWHPNHSGIRHLVFPLGLLVLQSVLRCGLARQVTVLSFTAVFLLLFNLETAIVVICGFGFYIYLQCVPIRLTKLLSLILPALAGAVAAIFVFWVLYGIGLGVWLEPSSLIKGVQSILRRLTGGITGAALFAPGYQNINLVFVPLAFVMFVHAIYLTVRAALCAYVKPLSPRELQLGATAVILLIWLGYFFNFPAPWNLWISIFLYGLILALLFNRRWIRNALKQPGLALRQPWPALATLCVLMTCASIYTDWINFNRGFYAPGWEVNDSGKPLAGILMPTKLVAPLTEKAAYLKAKSAAGHVVYTTLDTDFMPILSGVYQPGPERDFWTMVTSDDEMRQAVADLARKKPDWLLTDDEAGPLVFTGQRRVFQDHVQRIVGETFTLVDRAAGWKVWVLKKP
jgi:hypothetical protein